MNQIDIGKFIACCRREKGLTQAQLAEKLSITEKIVKILFFEITTVS